MEARRFEAAGSGLGPEGYSDNGGGPACAGSRLIIAFNSLPGLNEGRGQLRRHGTVGRRRVPGRRHTGR